MKIQKELTEPEIITKVIFFIIFFTTIGWFLFFFIENPSYYIENPSYYIYNSKLNNLCNDYGYEKATASYIIPPKYNYYGNGTHIKVECDNQKLTFNTSNNYQHNDVFVFTDNKTQTCIRNDKWGYCDKWKFEGTSYLIPYTYN